LIENQPELYLLKLFYNSTIHYQYSSCLKKQFIRDNSKELFKLFEALSAFHIKFPNKDMSNDNFEAWYYSCYPATNAKDRDILGPIFKKLESITPDPEIASEIIRQHVERVQATELSLLGMEVAEGKKDYTELQRYAKELDSLDSKSQLFNQQEFVSDDLEELLNKTTRTPGLRWRLDSMNRHLGSLRQGDFGFIFKRPETGGTTLLASEVTYFATQTDKPIIWFNNEEQGAKVKLRCFQALFGITLETLQKESGIYNERYKQTIGSRIHIVDSAVLSHSSVNQCLSSFTSGVSLIIFDQLDKIKGFTNDRQDLELKAIYQWARELAKQYAPVIGICQASASAEGKKYLQMDDVDNSKTGKQGEADWILGIGKSNQQGYEALRHFHLCKNKLIGDPDTVPERRHWQWDVIIDAELARYRDIK